MHNRGSIAAGGRIEGKMAHFIGEFTYGTRDLLPALKISAPKPPSCPGGTRRRPLFCPDVATVTASMPAYGIKRVLRNYSLRQTRVPGSRCGSSRTYRTKSVPGAIIHSLWNGYLVLWCSSSHTSPSPHLSGRQAPSALMPYRSLRRSTSASVGISRSVSAIDFGHSTCM